MRRIAVCLLIAFFVSAAAAARESRVTDDNSCSVSSRPAGSRAADRANTSPVQAGKTKSVVPVPVAGDDDATPRLQSPRWHRFLPGMFR